jgi:hypothetical protein
LPDYIKSLRAKINNSAKYIFAWHPRRSIFAIAHKVDAIYLYDLRVEGIILYLYIIIVLFIYGLLEYITIILHIYKQINSLISRSIRNRITKRNNLHGMEAIWQ